MFAPSATTNNTNTPIIMNPHRSTRVLLLAFMAFLFTACSKEQVLEAGMDNLPAAGNGYIRFKLDGVDHEYALVAVGSKVDTMGFTGLALMASSTQGSANISGTILQNSPSTISFPDPVAELVFSVTMDAAGNLAFGTWEGHTTGEFIFTELSDQQATGTFQFDNVVRTNLAGEVIYSTGHTLTNGSFSIPITN